MAYEQLMAKLGAKRRLPPPAVCKLIRVSAGGSQEDVARECGVTRAEVSRWEAGKRTPREPHLTAYLGCLDVMRASVEGFTSQAPAA